MKRQDQLFNLQRQQAPHRRRYAICGLSQRALTYFLPSFLDRHQAGQGGECAAHGRIVGILDIDRGRIDGLNQRLGMDFPAYSPDQFDQMIEQTQPDEIIVTTPDGEHAPYIVRALQHDLPVITEKPMVMNSQQAREVLEAEAKSRGSVRVTFNYRYTQTHLAIKRMIMEGRIGRPVNVELIWNMDTHHGASYFYRWNRDRASSGGVSVTKSCHHFDLVNWWLNDTPEQVFAFGALNYYGHHSPHRPAGADELPIQQVKAQCPYARYWDKPWQHGPRDDHLDTGSQLTRLPYNKQYLEGKPMYIYDREIEIEDTYSAVVRYRGGASMTYSANFSAPWEGYILGINGTHGRIEATHYTAPSRCPFPADRREQIRYYPLFGQRQIHDVPYVQGGHGGADPYLKHDLFVQQTEESKELSLVTGSRDGAHAVAVGEAIWRSVHQQQPIWIEQLLGNIQRREQKTNGVASTHL